jgi:hypothetical protein
MGLLDDAIREHLELKRKHGADLEAVARQEKEALGPGPRAEFAQPDAEGEDAPAALHQPEPERVPEPEYAPEPPAPAPEPPAPAPVVDQPTAEHPAPAPPATAEHVLPPPVHDESPWLDDEPDEVPAEEALERRRDQPTGEEDVLEETPDFLQETPEHDRLWFEQKPPRDFDWDK